LIYALLFFFNVYADDNFSFGDILLRGTGCKNNSARIVKTEDQQTISFLFDDFRAEVPNKVGENDNDDNDPEDHKTPDSKINQKLDHKMCDIILNANIKPGEQISHLEFSVDFRGSANLDKGAIARFRAKLSNWKGPNHSERKEANEIANKEWKGNSISEDWTISKVVNVPINSPCSRREDKALQLGIKTILQARILNEVPLDSTFAQVSLDSTDMKGHMRIKVVTKRCPESNRRNPGLGS
jgi:hypothetical protein